jgi:hypothetical protein
LLDVITDYAQPEYTGEATENNGVLYMKGLDWTSESSEEYAVYTYPQNLILTNSNHPFFVASPKLFGLMNEGCELFPSNKPKKTFQIIHNKTLPARINSLNGKNVSCIKLGDISEINQGISTGQNEYYVRKLIPTGSYFKVEKELILSDEEISALDENEKRNGIEKVKYNGRHFIPFDKGSDSNSDEGWMPNYFVDSEFYIDWSKESLTRMKTLTIAQRKLDLGQIDKINKDDEKKLAAALRNQDKWFRPTLSFSPTGQYSPTFRLGLGTVSQNTSSTILIEESLQIPILGILSSKFAKYLFKNNHNHTVHTQEGDVMDFSFSFNDKILHVIGILVEVIINKQKNDFQYDYASDEQLEIDKLVYSCYALNYYDIQEVENWYARRYPKLVAAQKRNLAALGKPTNYIEIYRELAKKYADLES